MSRETSRRVAPRAAWVARIALSAGGAAGLGLIVWAAGCASDAPARGGCPPTTYRSGAICAPILGTYCPAETRFVDGGGCVSDARDASTGDGDDGDDDFPAPWFEGRWATRCRTGTSAFRIERAGPSSVRQVHERGATHELKIIVSGNTIELHGLSGGKKHVVKYQIMDHKKIRLTYRFENGSQRYAYGTYEKCD